eukprot:691111-Rhodomonas_salina.2
MYARAHARAVALRQRAGQTGARELLHRHAAKRSHFQGRRRGGPDVVVCPSPRHQHQRTASGTASVTASATASVPAHGISTSAAIVLHILPKLSTTHPSTSTALP